MSKNVTQKEFTDYIDFEITEVEYDSLIDFDNAIVLPKLYKILTRKFNIIPKE